MGRSHPPPLYFEGKYLEVSDLRLDSAAKY
jgi:hypothetical protein